MTAMTDFDRMLGSWLESAGPAQMDERAVDRALATARRSGQRRGLWAFLAGPGVWPHPGGIELRTLPHAVRVGLVAALVAALLAGSLWVGSRLLNQPRPLPAYRGEFTVVSTLPENLLVGAIAPLPDGRAWIRAVVSDVDPGPAYIWDPVTAIFTKTADAAPRRASAPIVLSDGRFLFFDYADWSTPPPRFEMADIYEPISGKSVRVQDIDNSLGSVPVRLADGRILLAGGTDPGSDGFNPIKAAQIFDPASGTFAATGSLNVPRASSLTLLADGRVLVFGGNRSAEDESQIAATEVFDPATGTFSLTGSVPPLPPDTTGRRFAASWHASPVRLADGRVLIPGASCGEVHDIVAGYSATYWPADALAFDPKTATFAKIGTLPHCVNRAALLETGEVLVTGYWYETESQEPTSWAGLFDPVTGRTRELASPGTNGPYYTLSSLASGRALLVNDNRQLRLFE